MEASSKDYDSFVCAQKGTRQFVLSNPSCALGISENIPRFALFSHPSSMHTSLAANPKSV